MNNALSTFSYKHTRERRSETKDRIKQNKFSFFISLSTMTKFPILENGKKTGHQLLKTTDDMPTELGLHVRIQRDPYTSIINYR
jgi:hypothetical protein